MAFFKYIIPALAAASTAYTQCSGPTITIQNSGDASALQNCQQIDADVVIAPQTNGQISINGVQSISGDLTVLNVTQLTSLSADQLSEIGGTWHMEDLTILANLQFDSLQSVGDIQWLALPALQSLSFSQGIQKAKSVLISNTQLNNIDGIELQQVGDFNINNNGFMADINVNNLKNITGITNFAANGQDLKISFPNLIGAGNMTFRNVSGVSVPSLKRVGGALGLISNTLSSFLAPNLTVIDGSLVLLDNENLNNVSFPVLQGINGGFGVAANNKLSDLGGFPGLQVVSGAVDVSGSIKSFGLPALKDARGLFNFQTTETFDCSQFDKYDDSRVIKGKYQCAGKQQKPGGANQSPTGTASGAGATKTGAASSVNVPAAMGLGSLLMGLIVV